MDVLSHRISKPDDIVSSFLTHRMFFILKQRVSGPPTFEF